MLIHTFKLRHSYCCYQVLENVIKQPPFPHNKILIFRITKASYYRNVRYSSLGENVLKIGYNLPLGILADYKRRVRKVSLEGNIIFDKVLELANPVNNCFKHKQCYFCPKNVFQCLNVD